MRNLSLRILLAFLLVFSQVGALVHEIGHQGGGVAVQHSDPENPAADPLCALCLAFAQLAAFAQTLAPVTPALSARALQRATVLPEGRSVCVARGRNRDPPTIV